MQGGFFMSYEKAKKYLNKSMTREEFEAQVNELKKLDIPFVIPKSATGTVIPLAVILKQIERDEAERRHQEVLQAISKINKPESCKTGKIGNPGIDNEERKYRLLSAKEAEKMKEQDHHLTYKEIVVKLKFFPDSTSLASRVKTLENWIAKLHELKEDDPLYYIKNK